MPWKHGQRLRLATPEEAGPEAAEIYAEIMAALGVPFIDKLHQAYGACPEFLKAHWEQARKITASKQFFSCADRLGADTYTRVHSYLSVPDIGSDLGAVKVSEAARQEIGAMVDLFSRASSYSLLLCSWQRRAFEGPVGHDLEKGRMATPAKDVARPILMQKDAMPEKTRKMLEEIRKGLNAPAVDVFYVAMARWPDLLQDFWKCVQVEMASPMYDHSKRAIREYSEQLCDELPGPLELTTVHLLDVMDEGDISSMVRITDAFQKSFSALLLNVTWTQIGLDGGNIRSRKAKSDSQEPATPSAA